MKIKKITSFIFLAVIGLSGLSIQFSNQNPITFFALKNGNDKAKIYRVNVYVLFKSSSYEEISLSPREIIEAKKIVEDKKLIELKQLAKSFGEFDFVVGLLRTDDDFISAWRHFFSFPSDNAMSDLSRWDKIYLFLMTKPLITDQKPGNEVFKTFRVVPTATSTKSPVSEPIVRVEILNGCGIKGAAEWISERMKNSRIIVKNGGNAGKFTYESSVVQFGAELPAFFDQELQRIGFSNLKTSRSGVVPSDYDVVLIVGKDFRKLKGK